MSRFNSARNILLTKTVNVHFGRLAAHTREKAHEMSVFHLLCIAYLPFVFSVSPLFLFVDRNLQCAF